MQINWKLLYKDLDKFRVNLSFRELAAEWELPPSTFTRIKQGKGVSAETFSQIVSAMEVRVERYQGVAKEKHVVD